MRPSFFGFPPARTRARGANVGTVEKYERGEGPNGELTLADTEALVFTFSGKPDTIFVQARTNGAVIRMTDDLGRGSGFLTVHAGENFETHFSARKVFARNLTGGSVALLSIFGKWAERGQ